jgi:hypothetical protein
MMGILPPIPDRFKGILQEALDIEFNILGYPNANLCEGLAWKILMGFLLVACWIQLTAAHWFIPVKYTC